MVGPKFDAVVEDELGELLELLKAAVADVGPAEAVTVTVTAATPDALTLDISCSTWSFPGLNAKPEVPYWKVAIVQQFRLGESQQYEFWRPPGLSQPQKGVKVE
jgi:hypothetical protein